MKQTTHYNLTKPELQDSPPDITVMNPNWDLIDTYLHEAYINKLTAVDEIPAAPLPRDADRLGGFAASYFAPANLAQMKKLTDDNGLPLSTATDLNAMTNSGMYRVTASTLNGVPGNTTGILQVLKRDNDTFVFQQLQATGDGFLYRYSANNGTTWSSWKTAAFAENAIVESGSNANGDYVKFGDGTMICNRRASDIKVYTEIPLPASYKDHMYQVFINSYFPNTADRAKGIVVNTGVNNTGLINVTPTAISGQTITQGLTLYILTIGKWK